MGAMIWIYLILAHADIPKIPSTVQNVVVQNVSNFNKTLE